MCIIRTIAYFSAVWPGSTQRSKESFVNLKNRYHESYPSTNTLTLRVNIDGVPLVRSSKMELWPIFAKIKELPKSNVIIIGLYAGPTKPNSVEDYLNDFIQALKVITNEGLHYNGKHYNIALPDAFICDAPARAFLKCTKGHSGYNSCERCTKHGIRMDYKQAKLDDLEARSRRQNIRIIGIKEKAENSRPTEFVAKLLPELLGKELFDHPVDVDRAHRIAAPAKDGKPRAIIARLHRFQVKELVLRLAREKAPLRYDGRPVYIFPDLTSAIMKKRMAFQHIKEKCRARKIRCGFRHPARLVVTVNDNTGTFSTPAEAEKFLSREAKDWDTVLRLSSTLESRL
uniref:Uncharacterized protein n=1 Tax=Seriola lalandi dorsalis TaxID=1841481 RepID=A0A3B4XDC6_SERLL